MPRRVDLSSPPPRDVTGFVPVCCRGVAAGRHFSLLLGEPNPNPNPYPSPYPYP